jgi:regulator of protease activity HflC (stomatin/prohibitin superfamily)
MPLDTATPGTASQPEGERTVAGLSGRGALRLGALALVAAVAALAWGIRVTVHGQAHPGVRAALLAAAAALAVAGAAILRGLTTVAPGEALVVQVFGRYLGTVRRPGLCWAVPWAVRRRVSVKIRTFEAGPSKVNDADGNPIEIAAVVVWRVEDTARALYEVDDLVRFVGIQTETAVRHVATSYPYDARGSGGLSLRDNAREVTGRLSAEIAARVAAGGVRVVESRLTRLAYAPEVAQAMLRRQQADAVVAARQRIVEGAVGMVQMALARLDEEGVVVLDDERRAAMVSNLLVVLCSDQASQPVVNTGSLYQ